MDKEIFNRYENMNPPFDGKVLFTKTSIPIDRLRKLVQDTLSFLKENNLLDGQVYKVWDWFEHDGYLPSKEIISEKYLIELTRSNQEFYQNRSGDTYVRLGLYDKYSRWYMRIYIIDEIDLEEGEEYGGMFDISANEEVLLSLKRYLKKSKYQELLFEETKIYFGKRYAGR